MPFYFKINRLKIIDNKESGFLFFVKDRAEVKITSMIVTDNTDFPQLPNYKRTLQNMAYSKQNKTKELQTLKHDFAAATISQMISQRCLLTIDGIRDNQILTFGDTGYVLHQSNTIPENINWCLLAMEDDSEIREFGHTMQEILNSNEFNAFANSIAAIAETANPTFAIGMAAVKFIAHAIAKAAKKNNNDMIGLLYMSMNRYEHYPHGERKADNVPDLTNNMLVDYSVFGFETPEKRTKPKYLP